METPLLNAMGMGHGQENIAQRELINRLFNLLFVKARNCKR